MRTSVLTTARCSCGRELYQDEAARGRCDDCVDNGVAVGSAPRLTRWGDHRRSAIAASSAPWDAGTARQWHQLVADEPGRCPVIAVMPGGCECCGGEVYHTWIMPFGARGFRAIHARLADCLATTRRGSL